MAKRRPIDANHPDVINHILLHPTSYKFTSAFRQYLCQESGGFCFYCGDFFGLQMTIDHVSPRSLGGNHEKENLVAACKPCNEAKNNRPAEWLRHSIRLRQSVLNKIINVAQMQELERLGVDLPVAKEFVFHGEKK